MGLLVNNDAELYRKWFKEGCKLRGISVKYMYPIDVNITIHSEIQPRFSELIDMDIMFEENPQVKTLQRIGWVSEDPEDKPAIAYLPFDAPSLQTKSRICIPPVGQAIPARWFEVTTIHCNLEYPDCYICTLAPVFEEDSEKENHDDSNYNFISDERANQPEDDQPSNFMPTDENFKFLKL